MGAHVLLIMIIRPHMPSHMPNRSSAGFVHEGSLVVCVFSILKVRTTSIEKKQQCALAIDEGRTVRSEDFAGSNSQYCCQKEAITVVDSGRDSHIGTCELIKDFWNFLEGFAFFSTVFTAARTW